MGAPTRRVELPWLRAVRVTGISGWVLGAVVALVLVAVTAACMTWAGEIEYERRTFEPRFPYLLPFIYGYCIAMYVFLVGRARADLEALRPGLEPGTDVAAAERALATVPRGPLIFVVAIAAIIGVTGQEGTVARWSRLAQGDWNLADIWVGPMVVGFWCISAANFLAIYACAMVLRQLGGSLRVRLFDRGLGRPLARFGLRTFFFWVVVPLVLFMLALAFRAGHLAFGGLLVAMNVVVGAACLILPVGGLRARIREVKQAELARLDAAVQGDRTALAGSPQAAQLEPLSLPELLAYRERVEAHSEWPLDAPVLMRFALYGLLPILSWVAAALVERGLGVFLDR